MNKKFLFFAALISAVSLVFATTRSLAVPSHDEECDHEDWYAKPNNDRTHNWYCDQCKELMADDEDCYDFDKDGECDECGYEMSSGEEECEHEYCYEPEKKGSNQHIVTCENCEISFTEQCEDFSGSGRCDKCDTDVTSDAQYTVLQTGTNQISIAGTDKDGEATFVMYLFTPQETGTYRIYSSGQSNQTSTDLYLDAISIYQNEGEGSVSFEVQQNNAKSANPKDFYATVTLTEGVTYRVDIENHGIDCAYYYDLHIDKMAFTTLDVEEFHDYIASYIESTYDDESEDTYTITFAYAAPEGATVVTGDLAANASDIAINLYSDGNGNYTVAPAEANTIIQLPERSSCMFEELSHLSAVNFDNIETDNVTSMLNMFFGTALTSLDLSGWNTENVTNMGSMFAESSRLTSVNVSGWNTANVENMNNMFSETALTSLDLSDWNTENVTDMSFMFSETLFTTLDLRSFNTAKVENMSQMFSYSDYLKTIVVGDGFVTTAVTNSTDMFYNSDMLKGEKGTEFDEEHIDATYAHIDAEGNPGYFSSEMPCQHNNGSSYEYVDNGKHNEYCDDCGEKLLDEDEKCYDQDDEGEDGYGYCDRCDHEMENEPGGECDHDYYYIAISNGNGTHSCYCSHCHALIEESENEACNSDGDYEQCDWCGYKNPNEECEHENINYEYQINDSHNIYCEDCGEYLLFFNQECFDWDNDGYCDQCDHEMENEPGGECDHDYDQIVISNGNGTHNYYCSHCHALIESHLNEECNNDGDDGECNGCGYLNPNEECEHKAWCYEYQDNGYHNIYCMNCQNYLLFKEQKCYDWNNDGKCDYCDNEEPEGECQHKYYIIDPLCNDTHEYCCDDCEKAFKQENCVDEDEDGECDMCGKEFMSQVDLEEISSELTCTVFTELEMGKNGPMGIPAKHGMGKLGNPDYFHLMKFVAPKTGMIVIESSCDKDTYGALFNADCTELLTKDDDGGNDNNFSMLYSVEEGTTYYVGARNYGGRKIVDNVTITIIDQAPLFTELQVGKNGPMRLPSFEAGRNDEVELSERYQLMKFVAPKSAKYRIYARSEKDTYGILTDGDYKELAKNDDGFENYVRNDRNFCITYELEKDKTYYIGAREYFGNAINAGLNIHINEVAEEETFTLAVGAGSGSNLGTFVAPFAVTLPEGVEAYQIDDITDGNIVLKQVDEDGELAANTPVIVRNTGSSAVSQEYTKERDTESYENGNTDWYLYGVYFDIEVPNDNNWLLQKQNGEIGFYPIKKDGGIKVKAGKCYLNYNPNEEDGEAKSFTFIFDDDDATAVTSVSTSATAKAVYGIDGTSRKSIQRGVNIVKKNDGTVKKVIK